MYVCKRENHIPFEFGDSHSQSLVTLLGEFLGESCVAFPKKIRPIENQQRNTMMNLNYTITRLYYIWGVFGRYMYIYISYTLNITTINRIVFAPIMCVAKGIATFILHGGFHTDLGVPA